MILVAEFSERRLSPTQEDTKAAENVVYVLDKFVSETEKGRGDRESFWRGDLGA